jgi:transposase InsO family protein
MTCLNQTRTPRLNGKVDRSHGKDEMKFYHFLSYTDDVDLNYKISTWENYYNFHRLHGALHGKIPNEVPHEKLMPDQVST